jgi:hypothetical protein
LQRSHSWQRLQGAEGRIKPEILLLLGAVGAALTAFVNYLLDEDEEEEPISP